MAGGGCSGLSMAWHLLHYGPVGKKILLIDPDLSPSNNKTWCFWTNGDVPFVDLAFKTWKKMEVKAYGHTVDGTLMKFPYYCLREGDYKAYIMDMLKNSESIDLLESKVMKILPSGKPEVITGKGSFTSEYVFQSCYQNPDAYLNSKFKLKQHFVGWEINTAKSCFDPGKVTFMDFETSQNKGVTFFYTLPFNEQHALIEYTLFTDNVLEIKDYEQALRKYIRDELELKEEEYEVIRSEQGCIPMLDGSFNPCYGENVINLGTAAGLTKSSTGYTFTRIQKQCRQIADSLSSTGKPAFGNPSSFRFRIYDLMLLQIIRHHPENAVKAFYRLFRNNDFDSLLQFLDEKSSCREELRIFSTVPYYPFLRAFYKVKGLIMRGA
ncbi:MAG: lycopene cyclase family protein [Balneolales bacterium]